MAYDPVRSARHQPPRLGDDAQAAAEVAHGVQGEGEGRDREQARDEDQRVGGREEETVEGYEGADHQLHARAPEGRGSGDQAPIAADRHRPGQVEADRDAAEEQVEEAGHRLEHSVGLLEMTHLQPAHLGEEHRRDGAAEDEEPDPPPVQWMPDSGLEGEPENRVDGHRARNVRRGESHALECMSSVACAPRRVIRL